MSQVHSAIAEPTKTAARNRQAAADPAASTSAGGDVNFASLFAMTRESAWLDNLLDRQGEAAAARNAEQSRANQADARESEHESTRRTRGNAESTSTGRVERIKEARQERATEAGRIQESDQQPIGDTQGHQIDRAARQHRADRQRAHVTADPQTPASPEDEQVNVPVGALGVVQSQTSIQSTVQTPTLQTETAQSLWTQNSASPANGEVSSALRASVPAATTSEPSSTPAMPMAGPAMISPVAAAGKGDVDARNQQDLNGVATAVKAGGSASKSAPSTNDFQSLLSQVGRERASAVRQSIASATRGTPDESVRLTRPEAIDQLARVLRTNLNGKNSSMTLRLDPPELGQLRVDIRMQADAVTLRIQADTQAARDLIDNRMSDLRQALDQHGIRLDRVDVEIRPQTPSDNQGRETEGQTPQQHNLSQGGEPGFGQTFGQHDGSEGSQEAGASTGTGAETWTGLDASALSGLTADGADAPAETGVDLVV